MRVAATVTCPMDSNPVQLRDKSKRLCVAKDCNHVIVSLHNVSPVWTIRLSNLYWITNHYTTLRTTTPTYRSFHTALQNATTHYGNIQIFPYSATERYNSATNHYGNIKIFPYIATERYKPLHQHTDLSIQRYTERYKPLHQHTYLSIQRYRTLQRYKPLRQNKDLTIQRYRTLQRYKPLQQHKDLCIYKATERW